MMSFLRTFWIKITSKEMTLRFEISKQISDYVGFITRIGFLLATWYGAQIILNNLEKYINQSHVDNIRLIYEIALFFFRWTVHIFFGVNVLLLTFSIVMLTALAIQNALSSPDPGHATTVEEFIVYHAAKILAYVASLVIFGTVVSAVFTVSVAGGSLAGCQCVLGN